MPLYRVIKEGAVVATIGDKVENRGLGQAMICALQCAQDGDVVVQRKYWRWKDVVRLSAPSQKGGE